MNKRNLEWIVIGVTIGVTIDILFSTNFVTVFFNKCKTLWNDAKPEQISLTSVLINAFVAAVGFFAILISVQTDKKIKRYEYISDYNFHFLTSKQFFDVERKLETCFQEYRTSKSTGYDIISNTSLNVFFPYSTKENGSPWKYENYNTSKKISKEYQNIINYLVYLESFTPLLMNHQLGYKDIDNVFGYRYFIAVNNPFIQESELLEDWKYYRGCFFVYRDWVRYRKKHKIDIPFFDSVVEKEKECKEIELNLKNIHIGIQVFSNPASTSETETEAENEYDLIDRLIKKCQDERDPSLHSFLVDDLKVDSSRLFISAQNR